MIKVEEKNKLKIKPLVNMATQIDLYGKDILMVKLAIIHN